MADIRPRKRAAQSRSRATVAAIGEAAARILAERGLPAVTTNAVAERAGISVGSLYQYYPNREAILVDLLRSKLTTLLAEVRAAADDPSFDAAVRAMLAALSRAYLERPALAAALAYVETIIGGDDEIAVLRRGLGRAVARFLAAHGVAHPDVAARDVAALTRGMAMAAGLAGETDRDALLDRMERAVRGYLSL